MKSTGVGVAIAGSGSATPAAILTNDQLSQMVETSDEWIYSRTGIQERHITDQDESLCSLAVTASQRALEMAQTPSEEIDLVILATSTPDDLFGTAVKIAHEVGANRAVGFDLTAACSGFVVGVVTASQFLRTGVYHNALVIGGDVLSRWVDWSDRATCVLFGDGAGAVVLKGQQERDRLLGFELCSDGTQNHTLNLDFQGENNPLVDQISAQKGQYQPITMNGREIYRFAVAKVPEVISKALFRANLNASDIDWLILHQANQRIMDAVAQRLKLPPETVVSNVGKYGNTSAASIPIALDEAVRSDKIKSGDIIATAGFGAGLTWGAAIFEW